MLNRWAGLPAGTLAAFACLALLTGPVEAKYASVVIAVDTGEVLRETNADTRNHPASLTKMMTLYLLFEALESGRVRPDTAFRVSQRAAGMPPSKLGLRAGGSIRAEDALLALVTKSANDVAVVVAEALGGSESKFAEMMTRKARALGMTRTTFRNASGLHHREQLSTARDMARLARALMQDFPQYYHHFSVTEFRYAGQAHRNHNNLLRSYAGTDGVKTGYTRASGFNLAASAVRNNRRLIAVVFGGRTAQTRDQHMATLLDGGFTQLAAIVAAAPEIAPSPANPQRPTMLAAAEAPAEPIPPAPLKPVVVTALPPQPKPGIDAAGSDVVQAIQVAQLDSEEAGSAERGDAPPAKARGGYGVQVGAFYDAAAARRAATRAVEQAPHLLLDTEIDVSPIRGRRGQLYRGRLLGLTHNRAEEACRALHAAKHDCLVVRAGDGVNVAQN